MFKHLNIQGVVISTTNSRRRMAKNVNKTHFAKHFKPNPSKAIKKPKKKNKKTI